MIRLNKKSNRLIKGFLVTFLVISWLITGYPSITIPGLGTFPPKIKEANAAIAKVAAQPVGVTNSTASTTCKNAATTGFGVAGDTFVIVVSLPAGGTVTSVADNATGGSNTYAGPIVANNASGGHSELWYVLNAPRGNSGSLVITATFSSQRNSCVFAEYSGAVAAGTTNTNTGGANNTPTAATTTTSANSWMIAGMSDAPSTATWSAATGNLRTSVAGGGTTTPGAAIVDNTSASQGASVTTSATLSVSTKTWAVSVLELRSDLILPVVSPNGGSFNNDTSTTLSGSDAGATYCYTTNGTSPAAATPGTCSAGTTYAGAFNVTATATTVKVLATKAGWTNSAIVTSSAFTLTVANPGFSPNGGSFNNDTSTSFSSTTTGAVFCSTLDGSTPAAATPGTCSAGTTGASTTVIATGTSVKVLGTKANYVNSPVQTSSAFTLTVGAVSSSPGAGTYSTTQSVTLSVATTTGATIHFTTDGSAVSCASPTYTTAFNVSVTTTVKAIGCKTNYVSDTAISDLYTISATTFTQNIYRWYQNADSTTLTSAWGTVALPENAELTALPANNLPPAPGDKLRLEVNFTVGTANLGAAVQAFKLQYKQGTDLSCTTGSWTDVGAKATSATAFIFFDNPSVADTVTEVTKLSTSAVAGGYSEVNPTATNPNAATVGQDVEWDFPITSVSGQVVSASTYSFRMVKSDGTVFGGYTNCPSLVTQPGTADLLRHGNFFSDGLKKGFFWAN